MDCDYMALLAPFWPHKVLYNSLSFTYSYTHSHTNETKTRFFFKQRLEY